MEKILHLSIIERLHYISAICEEYDINIGEEIMNLAYFCSLCIMFFAVGYIIYSSVQLSKKTKNYFKNRYIQNFITWRVERYLKNETNKLYKETDKYSFNNSKVEILMRESLIIEEDIVYFERISKPNQISIVIPIFSLFVSLLVNNVRAEYKFIFISLFLVTFIVSVLVLMGVLNKKKEYLEMLDTIKITKKYVDLKIEELSK